MKKVACLTFCLSFLLVAQLQAAKCYLYVAAPCPAIALKGHVGEIQFVAFSPLGQRVVTVDDKFVRIWNARTGKLLRMMVWCVDIDPADASAFSSNVKRFVTLEDNTVKIWNTRTGRLIRVLQWCSHTDGIEFVALSPNGNRIVTVNANNDLQVRQARTGRLLRGLSGLAAPIESAAVSPHGRRVVTVSGCTVLIWTLP